PIVALLLALLFSFWSLGYRQHFTRDQILKFGNDCLAPTATILLVIGAGGGFNRVLVESGVGQAIADVALGSHASPLLLAWTVAETIIGVAGLGFTMLLSLVMGCTPRDRGAPELSGAGWIDVTATLDPARTPVYQGDAPMKFDFLKDMRKGDKLTLSVYSMGAHSGTHIDAPMHFVATGAAIDRVPLDPLIGTTRVIDIPDNVQAIDAGELNRHDWRGARRVLFRTRSTLRGWNST